MKKYIFLTIAVLFTTSYYGQVLQKRTLKLMGSRFDITIVAKDTILALKNIEVAINEITRIEKLISSWDKNSQTSEIIRNAGVKPVKVDKELYRLIERSLAISKLTDGAFDISYASVDEIWKFDGSMKSMPSAKAIKASVSKVRFQNIILNKKNQTVFLKLKGMKIGFGAIGKGYAADKTKKLLISLGVKAGIINASGDMNTWGTQPNGKDWKVAITNPMNSKNAFAILPISNNAIVTSGDYEKYVTFNNKRYTHIINPKTGYPETEIISVSVFAPKAELADALATSIFVMGTDIGLDKINQLKDIECIIINNNGTIHTSKNINLNTND